MTGNHHLKALLFSTIVTVVFSSTAYTQSCLEFTSPIMGKSITVPECTLSVTTEDCSKRVQSVEFQARYFPSKSDSAAIVSIGKVKRKPFALIWDISDVPNQLFSGVSFFAEATLSNGDKEAVRCEGVFFQHRKIERPGYQAAFDFPGTKNPDIRSMDLPASRVGQSISASVYWNIDELVFLVNVKDRRFNAKLSPELLASIGVEILLDPVKSRKPFPGKDVYIFSVPLAGKPYRILYKPVPDDSGSFKFVTNTSPCEFDVEITKNSSEGFSIYCPIPVNQIGGRFPEMIGCNLVVKTLSDSNTVIRNSWVKARNVYESYSPYLWGELHLLSRPIFMNRPLAAGLLFGVGFLVTLLISAIIMALTKPVIKRSGNLSDAERQQFAAMKEVFDSQIVDKAVTIDAVAKALSISPKKLGTLIRRATGLNFRIYAMYARIEIAKERLRSSHCSEHDIAEACGFHSTAEMEKFFMKFHHITPAKFRQEQQVV